MVLQHFICNDKRYSSLSYLVPGCMEIREAEEAEIYLPAACERDRIFPFSDAAYMVL